MDSEFFATEPFFTKSTLLFDAVLIEFKFNRKSIKRFFSVVMGK